MSIRETKIQIRCPINGKSENVYVRSLDHKDVHLNEFNGCDSNYHNCHECNVTCKDAAFLKYAEMPQEPILFIDPLL